MDFKNTVNISAKIYKFLEKFNLEDGLKLDTIIDNNMPDVLARLQSYSKIAKIGICQTNGKKTL